MVYVDSLVRPWRGRKRCHLVADTLDELHEFAIKLDLNSECFKNDRVLPHYDITESKRSEAIELGAIALTTSEMATRIREKFKEFRHQKSKNALSLSKLHPVQ